MPENTPGTLLLVDDEENVINSLKRLFRDNRLQIFTALEGTAALEVLEHHEIDIVISDMRMPRMSGAQLLATIAERWPNTGRILLTGFSDMESTMSAVNDGKIHNYISKPWDEDHLKFTVAELLKSQFNAKERIRLLALIKQQNLSLQELNASLEEKVQERTEQLQAANDSLSASYETLATTFSNSVTVFANLLELRMKGQVGYSRNIAARAKKFASTLNGEAVDNIYFAALLHSIGKIAFSDELIQKPYFSLNRAEREQFHQYPRLGETALLSLEMMEPVCQLIRCHKEQYNGKGYPDRLIADKIPLGSRLLRIVIDFEELQSGVLAGEKFTAAEACRYLQQDKEKSYDPDLVQSFLKFLQESAETDDNLTEIKVNARGLVAGMVLSRDLVSPEGMFLLAKDKALTEKFILRLLDMVEYSKNDFVAYVKK